MLQKFGHIIKTRMFSRDRAGESSGASASPQGEPGVLSADDLVLRIKNHGFLKTLQARGVPQAQMPPTWPVCGELLATCALDRGEQFQMASPSLLEQLGLTLDQAYDTALHNTLRVVHDFGVRMVEDGGGFLLRVGPSPEAPDTHLEAICLLYPGAMRLLEEALQPEGRMLVCVPTRDALFALDSQRPQSHARTLEVARSMFAGDATHGLSQQWMVRNGQAWEVQEVGP